MHRTHAFFQVPIIAMLLVGLSACVGLGKLPEGVQDNDLNQVVAGLVRLETIVDATVDAYDQGLFHDDPEKNKNIKDRIIRGTIDYRIALDAYLEAKLAGEEIDQGTALEKSLASIDSLFRRLVREGLIVVEE